MDLKARPTTYKGTKMRSRLEALYAQHCDQAGLAWQYEPGCFADETGQYLPDFLVTENSEHAYVEVKPRESDAAEWIDGPMRRIWASDRSAPIVAMWPERRPYESTKWSWTWRNPPGTTWDSICQRIWLPTEVTNTFVEIDDDGPGHALIRIDLIDDDAFKTLYQTVKPGDRWEGPRLPPQPDLDWDNIDLPHRVWRLVGPHTPTDAWFPQTIEVSYSNVVTDTYSGQHFFLNDLFGKLSHVVYTQHPYG